MNRYEPRLDHPADLASRGLALAALSAAGEAAARLGGGTSRPAGAELESALRSLLATRSAYRPFLPGPAPAELRSQLVRIAAWNAALRQRDWLADAPRTAPEAAAAAWLMGPHPPPDASPEVLERVRQDVHALRSRWAPTLSRLDIAVDGPGEPCGSVREILRPALALLADRIDGAAGGARPRPADVRRAGPAAGRALHLLSPYRAELDARAALLTDLRTVCRCFDDLRFAHRLVRTLDRAAERSERDRPSPGEGLRMLALRARSLRLDRLRRMLAAIRGGEGGAIAPRVRNALATDEGPGWEIERKFLLSGMPPLPAGADRIEIDQGWIAGTRLHERVRRTRDRAGERWYRTVKLGAGVRRIEVEEETEPELGRALWRLTEGRRLRKVRFRVPAGALVWEIDEFSDRGLVLAEIELPSASSRVEVPAWLAGFVVREVTGEAEFVNLNLAG